MNRYKKPLKGDLVRRTTDNAKGVYLYSYRDYDKYMTVAQWPDGERVFRTNYLWVYCKDDKEWKGVNPC